MIIENTYYSLNINEKTGKLQSYVVKGWEVLATEQMPLVRLRFRDAEGNAVCFDSTMAKKKKVCQKENRTELIFDGFENSDLSFVLSIVYEKNSPRVAWYIKTCCSLQLEYAEYPSFTIENKFKENGGDYKILWPYNEGVLVDSIEDREKRWCYTEPEYPSEGKYGMCPGMVSTPFMSLISKNNGVYIGAHDSNKNTFFVDFCRNDYGVELKIRVYPGIYGGNYESDFPMVLQPFEGDWYDGAEIYRSWFSSAHGEKFKLVNENPDLPSWYFESPLVVTYCIRGKYDYDDMNTNNLYPYTNALPYIDEIATKTDSKLMVLLMHWEGSAPWCPPIVWPPYGGEENFIEYVNALHKKGHSVGVYCSGLSWTIKTSSRLFVDYSTEKYFNENNLGKYMCASPTGEVEYSQICTWQRVGYDMCPSQEFCKKTIVEQTKKILDSGLDYVQLMDQNHGGTPAFCYSKEHGHPPVPGKWETEALNEIVNRIKEQFPNKKFLLGCESAAAEHFVQQFLFSDNRYNINYKFGQPVPLYSYLYHQYIHNFMGNQIGAAYGFERKIENLFYRLAYSFVVGDCLTVVMSPTGKIQWAWGQKEFGENDFPNQEETLLFINTLTEFRKNIAKPYLCGGKMVKPMEILNAKSFAIRYGNDDRFVCPILTARYELSNGDKGQVLVNFTSEDVSFQLLGSKGMTLHKTAMDYNGEIITNETLVLASRSIAFVLEKKIKKDTQKCKRKNLSL